MSCRSNKKDASSIFAARRTRVAKLDLWKLTQPDAAQQPEAMGSDRDAHHHDYGVSVTAQEAVGLLPTATQLPGVRLLA